MNRKISFSEMDLKYKIYGRLRRLMKVPLIWKLKFEYIFNRSKSTHTLPSTLIVSLTSYLERFKTLHKTLMCLQNQSIVPDKIILWIANNEKQLIPNKIKSFRNIEIRYCEDLRQYKKIIPTILEYPNSFVVTADDDIYYNKNWLKGLVNAYEGNNKEVICYRAHKIELGLDKLPLKYMMWKSADQLKFDDPLVFPTGCCGVLYPPGIFYKDVLKKDIFLKICPTNDDIWLWWMVRLNGGYARKINNKTKVSEQIMLPFRNFSNKTPILYSSNFNQIGLWYENQIQGGNDEQMKSLLKFYNNKDVFVK